MMKKKVTFIAVMYGENINGGAEVHCRMLAERLVGTYDVEVLTTNLISSKNYDQVFPEKEEIINGVIVRRFSTALFNPNSYHQTIKKTKLSRKIRRFFYRTKTLQTISNLFPIWNLHHKEEIYLLQQHRFYSPDLVNYWKHHHHTSDALILLSYPYPHTHFTYAIAPEKTILIPTAHNEGELFRAIQTHLFCKVKHIAFNTTTEQNMCKQIFGHKMAANSIVAVGTNLNAASDFAVVKEKYQIPANYLFYFGRIDYGKITKSISYFLAYKKRYQSDLKFVITGTVYIEKVEHPDIIYTGFVSEGEKTALITNATIVLNPSRAESLSLLMIEAMELGKTVLVNAQCKVLKQHCIDSDFAALYYKSEDDFIEKLQFLVENPAVRAQNVSKAQAYVRQHYDWNVVMGKLKNLIESI